MVNPSCKLSFVDRFNLRTLTEYCANRRKHTSACSKFPSKEIYEIQSENQKFSKRIPGKEIETTAKISLQDNSCSKKSKHENESGNSTITASTTESYVSIFTCKKCLTRCTRSFSKKAYHHGVVIVKCSGCGSLHMMSDQLGWFGNKNTTIEDILKEKGETVIRMLKENDILDVMK